MAAFKQQAQPASLPEALHHRATAKLVFPDGTALPANADLLAIHSPVLSDLLSGDVALRKDADGAVLIPLASDETPDTWLAALKVLYLQEPVGWGNVLEVAKVMDKYAVQVLWRMVHSFLMAADFDSSRVDGGATATGWSYYPPTSRPCMVWDCLVVAAHCKMTDVVGKCCEFVAARRLPVPKGLDLGCAAQPLAECLSYYMAGGAGRYGGFSGYAAPSSGYNHSDPYGHHGGHSAWDPRP